MEMFINNNDIPSLLLELLEEENEEDFIYSNLKKKQANR